MTPHITAAAAVLATVAPETEAGGRGSGKDMIQATAELSAALERLRELARGIYPPRLEEAGLTVSLESWLEQTPLDASVDIRDDGDRLAARTELAACVYFCLVTILSAVDDAGASRADVVLVVGGSELNLKSSAEVAAPISDTTLLAVRDRVEAFDGRMTSTPANQRSFELTAWLPLDEQGPTTPVAAHPWQGIPGR